MCACVCLHLGALLVLYAGWLNFCLLNDNNKTSQCIQLQMNDRINKLAHASDFSIRFALSLSLSLAC